MNSVRAIVFVVAAFLSLGATESLADAPQRVKIIGRKSAVVTRADIRLSDIAQVNSPSIADDEAVIALKKIAIGTSPAPGKSLTISASSILEKIKSAGVDLQQVGYSVPRIVTVRRASRTIQMEEVRSAIEQFLTASDEETEVVSVDYNEDVSVAPGDMEIQAVPFQTARPGFMGFNISANVENEEPVRFSVKARVNQWREVPVARYPITRGRVISESDVAMARMNIGRLPADAAFEPEEVLGLEVSGTIGFGEVFRKAKLEVPPMITAGSPVTIVYRSQFLEATATGVALEDGAAGDEIRVRNESSKKTVAGKVLEPGLVGVN